MKILVAPLDWGLGHTTRCIPIVRLLIQLGAKPVLLVSPASAELMRLEFPKVQIIPCASPQIKYGGAGGLLMINLSLQVPRLIIYMRNARKQLRSMVQEEGICGIISDNRPEIFLRDIPSVYITHQLSLKTGNILLNKLLTLVHQSYINRFAACWVPDVAVKPGLAGDLSHPENYPKVPVRYLGTLSRMQFNEHDLITCDVLVMISGPEPQRSLFEQVLIDLVTQLGQQVVFVRGIPGSLQNLQHKNIRFFNHLPASTLQQYMQGAKCIITRCGYSTIMDLVSLGKKAVLVPTPGQGEQVYLAKHLKNNPQFFIAQQNITSIQHALNKLRDDANRILPNKPDGRLNGIPEGWLQQIKSTLI